MLVEKVKPTRSAVKYDPHSRFFSVISGMTFYYNPDTELFEVDQNPVGELCPTVMSNIKYNRRSSCLIFEANYRGEEKKFVLCSKNRCDMVIYRVLSSSLHREELFRDDDLDIIFLSFEEGVLSRLEISKHKCYEMLTSLVIFSEGTSVVLLRHNPWGKVQISDLRLMGDKINYTMDENVQTYHLDVNPYIVSLLKDLLPQDGDVSSS